MSLPIIIDFHLALTLISFDALIVASIMPLPCVMMSVYWISTCLNRCQFHLGIGITQHVVSSHASLRDASTDDENSGMLSDFIYSCRNTSLEQQQQ